MPATSSARPFGSIRSPRGRVGSFVVRFTHEGTTYDRGGYSTRAAAEKARRRCGVLLRDERRPLAEVLATVFGQETKEVGALSFVEAAPHYLAFAKPRKRKSTFRCDVSRLRVACEASWAGKPLDVVTAADLLAWVEERQEDRTEERPRARRADETWAQWRAAVDRLVPVVVPGASGSTCNRDLAIVSALYEWAVRAGHAKGNPVRQVDAFPESRGREVYLTGPEARALVAACDPIIRPVVLVALSTGTRRGELLALKWRSIDYARRTIHVEAETEKAGRGRHVPMTADVEAALRALPRPEPKVDGSDPVFVGADGKPMLEGTLRGPFADALAAVPEAKRAAVCFHTLRHTAASLMVAAGIPILDVARILGHSTLAVTMRYAHFAPESGRKAIDALAQALAAPAASAAPDAASAQAADALGGALAVPTAPARAATA